MSLDVACRVAVVTGGGDGIGLGICRRYAAEGARVLAADARFVATDVSRKAQVQAAIETAVEAWGTVDILVNNAWSGGEISGCTRWSVVARVRMGASEPEVPPCSLSEASSGRPSRPFSSSC